MTGGRPARTSSITLKKAEDSPDVMSSAGITTLTPVSSIRRTKALASSEAAPERESNTSALAPRSTMRSATLRPRPPRPPVTTTVPSTAQSAAGFSAAVDAFASYVTTNLPIWCDCCMVWKASCTRSDAKSVIGSGRKSPFSKCLSTSVKSSFAKSGQSTSIWSTSIPK